MNINAIKQTYTGKSSPEAVIILSLVDQLEWKEEFIGNLLSEKWGWQEKVEVLDELVEGQYNMLKEIRKHAEAIYYTVGD